MFTFSLRFNRFAHVLSICAYTICIWQRIQMRLIIINAIIQKRKKKSNFDENFQTNLICYSKRILLPNLHRGFHCKCCLNKSFNGFLVVNKFFILPIVSHFLNQSKFHIILRCLKHWNRICSLPCEGNLKAQWSQFLRKNSKK